MSRTVLTLYRTELRMALRDRRTIIFSVVVPILVMPLLMFASWITHQKRQAQLARTTSTYAITGTEAETARRAITAAVARDAPPGPSAQKPPVPLLLEETRVDDPEAALAAGTLSFYVIAEKAPAHAGDAGERPAPGATHVTIVFRGDRDSSSRVSSVLRRRLRDVRGDDQARLIEQHGLGVNPRDVARVLESDLGSAGHVAGLGLGRILTAILLMFVFAGGAVVATDSLSGEKERGTLETLLTTAAGRAEIIAAKSLLIMTSAVVITAIQTLNLLLYVALDIVPVSSRFSAAVTPATVLVLFVIYLPVMALVSSALLATSGCARSYKEAQLYFTPLMLVGMLPALAPLLPSVHLRSAIVLVPIANIAVAVKEILVGAADWPMVGLAWLVTASAAVGLSRLTVVMLGTERLISSAHVDREEIQGGPALFPRRVLRAFAVMWAVMLASSSYVTEIRAQLLTNIGLVFVGGSFLLIRMYHLDVRKALALRGVKPGVWAAVIIGVPGGLLTAAGVFELANLVVPVSAEMLKGFGEALLPPGVPPWQALLLLTVLPGIGEEIAFRGVLLHGLHRRLHPAVLTIVVGAIFGLFHVALFRIASTAFLGVILAAVTLLTGSIFPSMLWHALSNGLGVGAALARFPLAGLPWRLYASGAVMLALAFFILWRSRTPYPGLRPWRSLSRSK